MALVEADNEAGAFLSHFDGWRRWLLDGVVVEGRLSSMWKSRAVDKVREVLVGRAASAYARPQGLGLRAANLVS